MWCYALDEPVYKKKKKGGKKGGTGGGKAAWRGGKPSYVDFLFLKASLFPVEKERKVWSGGRVGEGRGGAGVEGRGAELRGPVIPLDPDDPLGVGGRGGVG